VAVSRVRCWALYHCATVSRVQTAFLLVSTFFSVAGGSPSAGSGHADLCGAAGLYSAASRRNRVITQTWLRTAASNSSAAKPLSATNTSRRWGSQRLVWRMACRAQSVSVVCRWRCVSLQRADGARMVRKGSVQCRPDQGISIATISDSHRRQGNRVNFLTG